ncbi:MAG: hypothetical protein ACTHK7_09165 [Aureliella sp.]
MTERDFQQLFVLVLPIAALVYGIAIAVFLRVHDEAYASEASFAGGIFGVLCGVLWPLTILATGVGLVALAIIKLAEFALSRWRSGVAIAIAVAALSSSASAQCPRCGQFHYPYLQPVDVSSASVNDGLDEVNQARARKGLRPFQRDDGLTTAAASCAQIRASRRIAGHLPNDFKYVPAGTTARAAGCGALEPSWGWGTCCTYENYTFAGAAWVMGSDGRRYMHLFVR